MKSKCKLLNDFPTKERNSVIYRLFAQGVPLSNLAARYGISRQRAHQIAVNERDKRVRIGGSE